MTIMMSLIYHLLIGLAFILNAGPDEYNPQGGKNDQDNTNKKFPLEGNTKLFHKISSRMIDRLFRAPLVSSSPLKTSF